jgi:pyrroline-5-carboxylate reductase
MASNLKIGFLGAGKMATALAKGFVNAKLAEPGAMIASDPVSAAQSHFTEESGARAGKSNIEVATNSTVLILAVKPNQVAEVLQEIRPFISANHILISIAAGVPISKLEKNLGDSARVVRVMPNTPALVGLSASAFALGKSATKEDAQLTQDLFSAVGIAFELKESLLDAVTGLSGSGPAYVYMMIEALSDGGVAAGLPREVALKLAAQTVLGSAKMVLETNLHPGVLKDMVTSPGGTTVEGLHEIEKGGVRAALINAVRAAAEKSRKLGEAS